MAGILDRYETILLDMNGTFMFGEDRFGAAQDYHATYRELAGRRLTPGRVRRAVEDCYGRMVTLYESPGRCDSFPPVRAVLARSAACAGLPAAEIALLEAVIARHELGHVPGEHAAALRRLAATHRLGVVTNVWSRKPPWLAELRRAGVLDLFAVAVFSSDGPSMKPSPALFRQALATLAAPPASVVFVGDSLRCDVGGAAAAGLDSVWVNRGGVARPAGSPTPTFEVRSLLELVPAEPAAPPNGPPS